MIKTKEWTRIILETFLEESGLNYQDSLVIHPELLKSYVVPALWQRTGVLYTMYKRIGGVIAPVEGTVKVITGFGYAED